MVQLLAGLITYLLLAIYCYEQHNEKVSVKRVRQLRIKIQNEQRNSYCSTDSSYVSKFKTNSAIPIAAQIAFKISKNRITYTRMQKLNRKLLNFYSKVIFCCQ